MPPRRRQLSGRLLNSITTDLSADIQHDLDGASPRTLQIDGWDKDVEQLINAIVTAEDIEEFLGNYNATGKSKDASAMADLVISMLQAG